MPCFSTVQDQLCRDTRRRAEVSDSGEADLTEPSVKVSPDEHSMPNMATMSPAEANGMSLMSLACMRTRRGTCGNSRSVSFDTRSMYRHNLVHHRRTRHTAEMTSGHESRQVAHQRPLSECDKASQEPS